MLESLKSTSSDCSYTLSGFSPPYLQSQEADDPLTDGRGYGELRGLGGEDFWIDGFEFQAEIEEQDLCSEDFAKSNLMQSHFDCQPLSLFCPERGTA